jgi:hypothetical protein
MGELDTMLLKLLMLEDVTCAEVVLEFVDVLLAEFDTLEEPVLLLLEVFNEEPVNVLDFVSISVNRGLLDGNTDDDTETLEDSECDS